MSDLTLAEMAGLLGGDGYGVSYQANVKAPKRRKRS